MLGRAAAARLYDFDVATVFVHRPSTFTGDPNTIPRPRNAELSPFWKIESVTHSIESVTHSPLRGRSNTSRLLGPTRGCRTESHCASQAPFPKAAVARAFKAVNEAGRQYEVQGGDLVARPPWNCSIGLESRHHELQTPAALLLFSYRVYMYTCSPPSLLSTSLLHYHLYHLLRWTRLAVKVT